MEVDYDVHPIGTMIFMDLITKTDKNHRSRECP